jgi:class 3 adenylate cyclase
MAKLLRIPTPSSKHSLADLTASLPEMERNRRLRAQAKDGQILISSRIAEAVEAVVRLEDLGNLELKDLRGPVAAFNVVQSTSPAEFRPNLPVVARGPGA